MLAAISEERKHRHRIVPGLFLQQGIIDAAAVESHSVSGENATAYTPLGLIVSSVSASKVSSEYTPTDFSLPMASIVPCGASARHRCPATPGSNAPLASQVCVDHSLICPS